MGAQEAVDFICQNREAINEALERSAFIGDMQRDLNALDVEDPEG